MKKLLLILLCLPVILFSQTSGGPDGYGYTWVDSNDPQGPIYDWVDIEVPANLVSGLGDDNIIGSFPIESFNFYWYNVTSLSIGSNGFIAFSNPQNIASPFPSIPLASGANDFIAPLLSDLTFTGINNPGKCYFDNHNIDSTIVSFVDVPFWQQFSPQYSGSNTFQIILCHIDSSITFQYKSMSGVTTGNDITIGIESVAGSIGLQHSQDSYPQSSYSIRFTPPALSNASPVTDISTAWNGNNENKGIFLSGLGVNHAMISNISNVGNQNAGSINVSSNVTSLFGMPVVNNNSSINSLSIGQDTTIYFSTMFSPSTQGTYTFSSQATLVGDINPTNNTISQEIVVLDTSQNNINLCYANNLASTTLPGINWAGGNGGIAVYFEPSFYPAKLVSSNFGIDLTGSSFAAMIYDDNGPNGSPGTLIDSVFVDSNSVLIGWNNIPLSLPHIINDGGVYVLWYMYGNNISLARENIPPISRQAYEVLSGFWSSYRDYQTEDFFISIDIEKIPFAEDIGVSSILNVSNGIVQIEILNHGLNDISNFNVSYSVDGASAVSENISSNLLSGSSMNYIFSTPFSVLPGQYEVCSWTDYNADMQHNNDTSCVTTTIVGVNDFDINETERILLKITDLLGRETKQTNQPLLYIYDDGTVEKRIVIE
ncbi:MAG: hypothetical protein CMD19_06290 [Flavobacteriales bacterium]|nr:hypothetical protein [Flavobacteriales bacterium]